mgnify:CR=1 FL=1
MIKDEDLEQLCRENPLASEQLRRIIAERRIDELEAALAEAKGLSEGVENGNE